MQRGNSTTENHFLDRPNVASLDRSDMFGHIGKLPGQLKAALELSPDRLPDIRHPVANVLICGLGGSAIGGGLISRLVRDRIKVPLQVCRSIGAPAYADSRTLAFVISYSGNTLETLSTFQDLLIAGSRIVTLTSGGELAERARSARVPLIRLPPGMPPRAAIGYTSVPLARQLAAVGLCEDPSHAVREAAAALAIELGQLSLSSPYSHNLAKQIADTLSGRVVSVYGSQGNLDVVARRWAGQIAENGKQIAFWNVVPEALHNEIVGWSHPRSFFKMRTSVLLRDPADPPRIQQLFQDMDTHLLAEQSRISVHSSGRNRWEKVFKLILLGDLVSAYVALLNGEDPTPIAAIEAHKARLRVPCRTAGSSSSLDE